MDVKKQPCTKCGDKWIRRAVYEQPPETRSKIFRQIALNKTKRDLKKAPQTVKNVMQEEFECIEPDTSCFLAFGEQIVADAGSDASIIRPKLEAAFECVIAQFPTADVVFGDVLTDITTLEIAVENAIRGYIERVVFGILLIIFVLVLILIAIAYFAGSLTLTGVIFSIVGLLLVLIIGGAALYFIITNFLVNSAAMIRGIVNTLVGGISTGIENYILAIVCSLEAGACSYAAVFNQTGCGSNSCCLIPLSPPPTNSIFDPLINHSESPQSYNKSLAPRAIVTSTPTATSKTSSSTTTPTTSSQTATSTTSTQPSPTTTDFTRRSSTAPSNSSDEDYTIERDTYDLHKIIGSNDYHNSQTADLSTSYRDSPIACPNSDDNSKNSYWDSPMPHDNSQISYRDSYDNSQTSYRDSYDANSYNDNSQTPNRDSYNNSQTPNPDSYDDNSQTPNRDSYNNSQKPNRDSYDDNSQTPNRDSYDDNSQTPNRDSYDDSQTPNEDSYDESQTSYDNSQTVTTNADNDRLYLKKNSDNNRVTIKKKNDNIPRHSLDSCTCPEDSCICPEDSCTYPENSCGKIFKINPCYTDETDDDSLTYQ